MGFDRHPETGRLRFTDNGRDWLGDNRPPDELNMAEHPGEHFGFFFIHGKSVKDPEFGDDLPAGLEISFPEQELGPHVAAPGMRFYTGKMFPEEYRDGIFIAEHGSWNRSEKIGYRVMRVILEEGTVGYSAVGYEPFATGWLDKENDSAWGRPVDVLVMPDGSLLVSDDAAGNIYRITYE